MKSLDINAMQAAGRARSGQGLVRFPARGSRNSAFLALAAGFAIFIGLFIPFLGFQSGFSFLAVVLILAAFTGFVIVVYYATQGRQWALLVFFVLLVFLIDATFRKRELTDQSLDAQTLLKAGLWCSALLIAFISTRGFVASLFQGDIKWLTIFSLLALGSTAYSLTPAFTFGGGVAAVSYCAISVCAATHLTRQQILYSLLVGMSIMLVISLAMFAMGLGMTALETGPAIRLAGIAGSPNGLGRTASLAILVVGVLVVAHRLPIYSWRCVIPTGLAVSCLVLSDSRTSTLALIAAFGFYLLRRRPVSAFIVAVAAGFTSLVLLNMDVPWQELMRYVTRTGRISEMTTLTGRTDIWYATWNAFLERPLLGYGYGSTKILLPEVYRNFWGFTVSQAHNLYLQTLVTTGVVGLALVLMAFLRQIIGYITHPQPFSAFVVIYMMAYGLTEPGPIATSPNILTFVWALSLCWDRVREDSSADAEMKNYRRLPKSRVAG